MFLHHRPSQPLTELISMLWLNEGDERPHAKERILPSGTIGIVINLQEDETRTYDRDDTGRVERCRGAMITGACSEYSVIDTDEQRWCMGVQFKAGGAFPFLGMPAVEIQDTHLALDMLWGAGTPDLRDRLLAAPTPAAKFRALETTLLERMARGSERHPAVRYALRELAHVPQARTVAEVTDQAGLSARRFIQLFSAQVGLTPKLYCRVRRFQEVLRLAHQGAPLDWTDVALSCGYFDQPHFNRDFRAFSGLSPSAYLAQRSEHRNHVPILD